MPLLTAAATASRSVAYELKATSTTSRTSSNDLGLSPRCVRSSILSSSLRRSKNARSSTSSGTTLPCTGRGNGTLKIFLTLLS